MLDKYIRLFLEVSFVDMLKQSQAQTRERDDENKLRLQKAKEEREKRKEKDKNMTPEEYANLVLYGNSNYHLGPNSSLKLTGVHSGSQKRPRGKS